MARRPAVIDNTQVAAVFRSYHSGVAAKLLETLRWGQPSYLTAHSGSGSTIRIDQVRSRPGRYAIYFHCRTTLVETFRRRYPGTFRYEGNRAILFEAHEKVPKGALGRCIALALIYHRSRGRRHRSRERRV
jgi:hypothetical protein